MLSRVAESLYWLGRYVERAEDVARLLDVEFHALLDTPGGLHEDAWRELLWVTGKEQLFREHSTSWRAPAITDFLLWHPGNPDAVRTCIQRARENARGVREQISSEMWERINRLYLLAQATDRTSTTAAPHAFFVALRDASHGLQGMIDATMPRGEAYDFLRLGLSLERADETARVVCVKIGWHTAGDEPDVATERRLTALLRSCSAHEAFRRHEGARLAAGQVTAYLVLERTFPRSVRACLLAAADAVARIDPSVTASRTLARLLAELQLYESSSGTVESLRAVLERVMSGIADVGAELGDAFFTTHALAAPSFAQAQQ